MGFFRQETRRQRYDSKNTKTSKLPVSLVVVNFDFDDNLAFTIRTAACYGARNVYVIGSVPDRKFLNPKSGSLYDYVSIEKFSNPSSFLKFARDNNILLISADLTESAKSIYEYKFDLDSHTAIILGNETTGIPIEISMNSSHIYIPMPGPGFCLNTSQAGTAIITEYSRQFFTREDAYDKS